MLQRLLVPSIVLVAPVLTLLPGALSVSASDVGTPAAVAADSVAEERARYVQDVLATIEGREQDPAGEVFEDIKEFADVPAKRLLRIMDLGFGRSLGVSCTHCHTPDDWASSDSTAKLVARQMVVMSRRINDELLPAIEGIRGETPTVNCTTCHRGSAKPALNMPR